jgi:hypothetical protein
MRNCNMFLQLPCLHLCCYASVLVVKLLISVTLENGLRMLAAEVTGPLVLSVMVLHEEWCLCESHA